MPKWFQMPEVGAGKKRLILTKNIYQIFGEVPVRVIAFFVALTVFVKSKDRREFAKNFYESLGKKHPLISAFYMFVNYANSLVDKFISCLGRLNPDNFILPEEEIPQGTFFITTHVGNVEVLRTLFQSDKFTNPKRVNVFLQGNACEIFNNFLKTLEIKLDIEVFPVEEISADTSILISERLKSGELVFMAGDRVSAQNENKTYTVDFFGKKAEFPLGTLKFALMMDAPVSFIVCVKEGKNYKVFTQKFVSESETRSEKLKLLQEAYLKFLKQYVSKYPLQFYNFGG